MGTRRLSVLLSVVLLAPWGAAQEDLPELGERDEVVDEITGDEDVVTTDVISDAHVDAPVIGRRYVVEPGRSSTYHFDMRSAVFDTYLVLRDASGKVVAEDDDGLVATHSRIVTELERGRRYLLDACALHGGRGAFRLSMGRGEPKPGEGVEWSEEEIEVRLKSVFPEELWDKVDVIESKHYLIFTDSGSGKKFGKILDNEVYDGFRDLFPFDKPANMRRMPIYLFNTRDRYIDFLMRHLDMSRERASSTGGIQYRDYYATSYSSPRAPVHFHECAHQIMKNILRLGGGGSWFQEGIAEYYEDKVRKFNRRAEARMQIRTEQSATWRQLLAAKSMLFSAGENTKGAGGAGGNYGQAASIILFLKEGPYRKSFDEFLHAMGKVPRSDMGEIERVFQEVYGKGIDELEAEWVEYFAG